MGYDEKTLVLVGSKSSGKSSIFNCIYRRFFNHDCFVQGTYFTIDLRSKNVPAVLAIFDTSSMEELFDIRRITYLTANVILLIFSLDDINSLRELEEKWYPEVKYYAPEDAAKIVVGNKKDLRSVADDALFEEGLIFAKKMNAAGYMECSALTDDGVLDVILHAARVQPLSKESTFYSSWCNIL